MALWPTQPLVKMSTRSIPGRKGSQCHHTVPLSRNLGVFNFSELSGPVQACYGTALPFVLPLLLFKA